MDINKSNKKEKSETSREGERNRKFVSDSSLMQFLSTSSEEMKRNSQWPWNSVAPNPAAFGGPSRTSKLVETGGAGEASSHRRGVCCAALAEAARADFGPKGCL